MQLLPRRNIKIDEANKNVKNEVFAKIDVTIQCLRTLATFGSVIY